MHGVQIVPDIMNLENIISLSMTLKNVEKLE